MKLTRKFQHTMLISLISTSIAFLLGPLSALASGPHDVRPGMTIEEATRVAIHCIQAASRMQTKDIRLQDTLTFVGINDEMRLDALRRHIVRNPNIGVGSVRRKFNGHDLRYLILNESLLELDTSATVAKLAQTIVKHAGLARLTYARAAAIVAKCRAHTQELDADKAIVDDPNLIAADFMACLLKKNETKKEVVGVSSAGVTDPTGKEFRYTIDQDLVRKGIIEGRWSYNDLIKKIGDEAYAAGLKRIYGGN